MHRLRLFAVVLAAAAILAVPTVAGAQSAPRPAAIATVHHASVLAVPKFVFHAGLAFGAFHHFIYEKFKNGDFTKVGFLTKIKNYLEAGIAAIFVYHEIKLALADAQQNKVLKLLVTPLTAAVSLFNKLVSQIKGRSISPSTVSSTQNSIGSIESLAQKAGSSIKEVLPSASQLASGSA